MKRQLGIWVLLLLGIGWSATSATAQQNYEFSHGNWFDGRTFTPKKFYTVNGVFTARKPAQVERVIDLTGKYVVPPFGEAHNHNVESSRIDAMIKAYLQVGIFYVKNPNSLPRFTTPLLSKINLPTSIDAIFSGGGLTGSGGHPVEIVQRSIQRKVWTEADGEGAFYFTIDNQADLDRKWETIKTGKPDFIKTYLLFSEEYDKRKDDPAYLGLKGLDPKLLPEIVRRAHNAGLRVSTHIETAKDFHHALMAGADEINHMVGYSPDLKRIKTEGLAMYEIAESDARLAGKRKLVVVTTLHDVIAGVTKIEETTPDVALRQEYKQLLIRNLQLLKKHGVRLAIGSDHYRSTAALEAERLAALNAFDNLTLLKLWCEETAAAIFPKRKIGYLKEGYEASFLVLSGNPVSDFANVKKIEMRVKQGTLLP